MALKEVQAQLAGTTRIYAVLKGPANTDVFVSDQAFLLTSYSPTRSTYPVVADWGPVRSMLPANGQDRESDLDIAFLANEYLVFYDVTTRKKVIDYLRTFHGYDTTVIIYTWNEADTTQYEIWRGYSLGIVGETLSQDGATVVLRATTKGTGFDIVPMSDIVQRDATGWTQAYPDAPTDSLGAMVPRAFGKFFTGLTSAQTAPNDAVFLGYGTQGVEGVVTAENIADMKADVEFMRVGTVYDSVLSGTTNDPSAASHFWVHMPEANTYGMIDAGEFTATNNSTQVKIQVKLQPVVFAALRPGGAGATMASGFTATAYKLTNDDHTDFIESDGVGNHVWALNIPPLGSSNFRVIDIRLVVDIENASGATRDIDYGIWDVQGAGGTPNSWLGGTGTKRQSQAAISATRTRYYTSSANAYTPGDFLSHAGSDTSVQAGHGDFVSTDSSDNAVQLQAYVQVSSASKNGVRLYGIGIVVKGLIWLDRVRRTANKSPVPGHDPTDPLLFRIYGEGGSSNRRQVVESTERSYSYIFTGVGHEETGTTYEGGSAGDPLRRLSPIVHYTILAVGTGGESVNTTAGTVGNFTDARSEVQAGEKRLSLYVGPDPMMKSDFIREVNSRSNARFFKDRGIWQCVYDEMNPHSSRFYRSTSDFIKIKATEHVVGPVQVFMDDSKNLVNVVTLNYGHTFGSNRPVKSHGYSNPNSIARWGSRRPLVVDEPWIVPDELGVVPEAAKFVAKYRGRANARPRMTLVVPLSLAFYDLQRGHVLEMDTDWESIGWECPAYRCGLLDFAFHLDSTATSNMADSATPFIMPAGSTTSESYFASHGMFPSVALTYTSDTGAHTEVNNGWEYSSGVDSSDEPTWTAFSGVAASDGGDPDTFPSRAQSTPLTISWTRPGLHQWIKCERTFGSGKQGPFYWARWKYNTATNLLQGNGQHTIPATWHGRPFEVIEVAPKFSSEGQYDFIEAVLREVY